MSAEPGPGEDDERLRPDEDLTRLLAFSDGVFAIAITILVLELDIPPALSTDQFFAHLHRLLPRFGSAALSFAVIGRFWIAHRQIFSYIERGDRALTWLNLLFLGPVVAIPFTTELLGAYSHIPTAVMAYAGAITAAACAELMLWWYVVHGRRLVDRSLSRRLVADRFVAIGATVVAFVVSIPLALIHPLASILTWLVGATPTMVVTTRLRLK